MFDIELFALLSEIVAGTAVATAILFFVWLSTRNSEAIFVAWLKERIRFFTWRADDKVREYLVYPIGVALVLAIGLASQSAVDDAIDTRPVGLSSIAAPLQVVLQTKDAYRFSALFALDRKPRWWDSITFTPPVTCTGRENEKFKLTPLGREILVGQPQLIARFLPGRPYPYPYPYLMADKKLETGAWRGLITSPDMFLPMLSKAEQERRCKIAIDVAKGLYYDGNNWAMMNDASSRVLRRWQIQIDMLGSVALASIFVVLTATGFWAAVRWDQHRKNSSQDATARSAKLDSAKGWCRGGLIVGVLCTYGYVIAYKDYTNRAIGMYLSYMAHQDAKLARVDCDRLEEFLDPKPNWFKLPVACKVSKELVKESADAH